MISFLFSLCALVQAFIDDDNSATVEPALSEAKPQNSNDRSFAYALRDGAGFH